MKLGMSGSRSSLGVLGIFIMSVFLVASFTACNKEAAVEEARAGEAETGMTAMVKEGLNEFEGTVKVAHGPFIYIPEIVGFDVIVPASVDTTGLEGKPVRLEGEFKRDNPSILSATRIDLKEGDGDYTNVYAKTGEETLPSFLNQHDRESFAALKLTSAAAADAWEGKGRGRVFGKLEKLTAAGAGEAFAISIADEKGKAVGQILVDSISDYAAYYIKKLRLFDSYWFYLNIKESVEAKTRARTKELFHADIVFTGLY